jgi:small subunit ribosomal protein S20
MWPVQAARCRRIRVANTLLPLEKSRIMRGLSRGPKSGLRHPFKSKDEDHMANTAQARKRAKQSEETRKRNASMKSALRTAVKNVKKAIGAGDKAAAAKTLQTSQAIVDRIADKKIVHKNLASRTKSRLAQAIKAMA